MPALADLTRTPLGVACAALFVLAYALVMAEERLRLRKSKPMILCAGVIWILVSRALGHGEHASERLKLHVGEFAELLLFLTVAMSYVQAIATATCSRPERVAAREGLLAARGVLDHGRARLPDLPGLRQHDDGLLLGAVVIAVGARTSAT
jgi:hypothetical protein